MTATIELSHWINGERRGAGTVESLNPSDTREVVALAPEGGAAEVDEAVAPMRCRVVREVISDDGVAGLLDRDLLRDSALRVTTLGRLELIVLLLREGNEHVVSARGAEVSGEDLDAHLYLVGLSEGVPVVGEGTEGEEGRLPVDGCGVAEEFHGGDKPFP